jgi:hypothetical protein
MQTENITIELSNDLKLLEQEPHLIQKVYFDPSSESIWAKHYFSTKPIFLGIIPKDFVSLFHKNLIKIKSWKLDTETYKLTIKIEMGSEINNGV